VSYVSSFPSSCPLRFDRPARSPAPRPPTALRCYPEEDHQEDGDHSARYLHVRPAFSRRSLASSSRPRTRADPRPLLATAAPSAARSVSTSRPASTMEGSAVGPSARRRGRRPVRTRRRERGTRSTGAQALTPLGRTLAGLRQAHRCRHLALPCVQEDDCRWRVDRLDHRCCDRPEVRLSPLRSLACTLSRPRADSNFYLQHRPSPARARGGLNPLRPFHFPFFLPSSLPPPGSRSILLRLRSARCGGSGGPACPPTLCPCPT